jgi:hypothetical protein
MSSERRIRASQENGAKSRGPKTPEGKRRSSRNNLRHGLLARTVLLSNECPKAFAKLLSALEKDFQPWDTFSQSLVETMALARWRYIRVCSMEAAVLQDQLAKQQSADVQNPDRPSQTPSTQAGLAFHDLCDRSSDGVDHLARAEDRFERQYARTYDLLEKHRANRGPAK